MKYINKNTPPSELVSYRRAPGASYDDMVKNHHDIYDITRLSLAEEQGYICCYCGKRITGLKGTQIEHIFAKGTAAYSKMQLDYETNLLACCDGGKYERKSDPSILADDLHCDTKKSNDPIPVTPLQNNCQDKFVFDIDGTILGISADAEVTIQILNLTSPLLNTERKYAIDAYSMFPSMDWKEEWERLEKRNSKGEYVEYCFVLQRYIEIFHEKDLKAAVHV